MRYPGGKGKCFQHVINLMPPHRVYIESHLGGGAVLRHKAPAPVNIGIDANARVIDAWRDRALPNVELRCGRAEDFLNAYDFQGDEVVYADPPYHPGTRRRERVYAKDYSTQDHERLLALLIALPCKVILSGYDHPLYRDALVDWNVAKFQAKTHADVREETLWFNFEHPRVLHDDRFMGKDHQQRQSVRRRMQRLQDKVHRMDPAERSSFARWLNRAYPLEEAVA